MYLKAKIFSLFLSLVFSFLVQAVHAEQPRAEVGHNPYGAYLSSIIAEFGERDMRKPLVLLEAARAEDPKSKTLKLKQHYYFTLVADYDGAAFLAQELIDQEPEGLDALTRSELQRSLYIQAAKRGDWPLAQGFLPESEDPASRYVYRPLFEAFSFLAQGNANEGAEALKVLLESLGGASFLLQEVGNFYWRAGDSANALDYYKAAISRSSRDYDKDLLVMALAAANRAGDKENYEALLESYNEAGITFKRIEDLQKAVGEGKEVVVKMEKDTRSHFALFLGKMAEPYLEQNNVEGALTLTGMAYYLFPESDRIRLQWADLLSQVGRYNEALEQYDFKSDEKNYTLHAALSRAQLLDHLERDAEALQLLEILAQDFPNSPRPIERSGDIYRFNKDYTSAAKAYRRAVMLLTENRELRYEDWPLLYAHAISLERKGVWKEAEEQFLKALELAPDQPDILNYLAYSWIDYGYKERYAQALEMLQSAVKITPDSAHIIDSLAWAYFKLGHYEEALDNMERALERMPQDPVLNSHMGDIYWVLGREREAAYQWKRALMFEPDTGLLEELQTKLVQGLNLTVQKD